MSDTRTLAEKLRAMADQDVSPYEAEIARAKLAEMGDIPPPPNRPTAVAAPSPWDGWYDTATTGYSGSNGNFTFNFVFGNGDS